MKKLLALIAIVSLVTIGCRGNSYPKTGKDGVSNVTYVGAFSHYGKVYKTAYGVLNDHALIKHADYYQGKIVAELLTDRHLMDKTRTMIYAHIKKRGRFLTDPKYYDVEIRVVKQIDTSEANYFSKEVPPYRWRTVYFDDDLELKLLNKIKLAMTKGAYFKKKSLAKGKESKSSKSSKTAVAKKNKEKKESKEKSDKGDSKKEAAGKTTVSSPDKKDQKEKEDDADKSDKKVKEDFVDNKNPTTEQNNFNSYVLLGTAYANKGRWKLATLAFRSALAYMPNKQSGYYYLAAGLIGQEKYEEALEILAKGLSLNKKPQPIYLLELFSSKDQFQTLKNTVAGSQQKELLQAFLLVGMGRNDEARGALNGIDKKELKPLVKKLNLLANKKNSDYRKYY